MARKFVKLAIAATLLGSVIAAPSMASAAAPAPALINDNATAKFGDWYVGAIPSNVDYSKPVILFVQGLHSDYTTWYNSDGFYDAAYNAGYRTAFVQLKDADGDGGNMWTNGPVLASVIQKVKNYYGVSKINIVAHSKGGIDTQAALVHYGAYPYVNLVHQLSTPNKGSEIADMAYSAWAGWMAGILGQKDEAVYSLQTSYMANFRSQTDYRVERNYARTYMSGGTGDDGLFSSSYYSRAFLPGEDDGAVAIYSAFGLPWGYSGFTDNGSERLSHTKMRYASKTWWQVKPRLTTYSYYGVNSALTAATTLSPKADLSETSNVIMRGGVVDGLTADNFTLESGLGAINIDLMTASADSQVTLISPSGKEYKATKGKASQDDLLFNKASHNIFSITKPEKGIWTVEMTGTNDAYFMAATIEGGAKATIKANKKVVDKDDAFVQVNVAFDGGKVKAEKGKEVKKAKVTKSNQAGAPATVAEVELTSDAQGNLITTMATPAESGVYNVSFDVTGVNAKGEEFTRSVNYNFAVEDTNGKVK